MTRIALTGGAYTALSVIAAAQRQVNLYSEPIPAGQGEPSRAALFPTPGTRRLLALPQGPVRGGRRATNGTAYVVAGSRVYAVHPDWTYTDLGGITPGLRTPVSLADNGLELVIVDGTAGGWQITLADNTFQPIASESAYRYWRLNIFASGFTGQGGFIGVGEISFTIGGVRQMGSGIASASGQYQGFTPDLASDGTGASSWIVNAPAATWMYDFGAGQAKAIDGLTVWARSDSSPEMAPSDFAVECSQDGASWRNVASFSRLTWTLGEAKSHSFTPPLNAAFRGADRADYMDTFMLFNVPGTPQFQSSDSLALTFNPLYFANKEAHSDLLVSLVVAKREIWLLGTETSEVWINSGKPDFPFEAMPGVFIDRGCAAKYSPAETDNSVYWLAQDRQGQGIVMKGGGYQAARISTFAIEQEMATYPRIDDAIGMTYQLGGHLFYVLTFPHADKTWAYDIAASQAAQEPRWHEWVWLDTNGTEHRHRANCMFAAYGEVVCGDWETGNLYALDQRVFLDDGAPIKRLRHFPHMLSDGDRVIHRQLIADMETGTGGNALPIPPRVSLAWSNDRGHSYGSPISQSLGASGEYLVSLQFQRLGLARDRIYQIGWSTPYKTALQGMWLDARPAAS